MKYNVNQAAFCSTLMSSIKGVYQHYYQEDIKDSLLFGLSGHAFMINITNGIGPCAPYTFDMKEFNKLVKTGIGVDIFTEEKIVTQDHSKEVKKEVATHMIEALKQGTIITLGSYEYQLVVGYNDDEFITTIPWDAPSCTPNMNVENLEGMKEFMGIYKSIKHDRESLSVSIRNSIDFAISLYENPITTPDSAMGIKAYDFWLEKMNEDNCNGHGLWWSSNVWAESREFASEYMIDLKEHLSSEKELDELSRMYKISASILRSLSNKEGNYEEKVKSVNELKQNELEIYEILKKL